MITKTGSELMSKEAFLGSLGKAVASRLLSTSTALKNSGAAALKANPSQKFSLRNYAGNKMQSLSKTIDSGVDKFRGTYIGQKDMQLGNSLQAHYNKAMTGLRNKFQPGQSTPAPPVTPQAPPAATTDAAKQPGFLWRNKGKIISGGLTLGGGVMAANAYRNQIQQPSENAPQPQPIFLQ